MAIRKIAKAVAGGVVSVAALWVTHLTGFTLSPEIAGYLEAVLTTVFVGGLTAVSVYLIPNEPDAPDKRS